MRSTGRLVLAGLGLGAAAGAVWAYARWLRPWQVRWGAAPPGPAPGRWRGAALGGRPNWNATRAVTVAATPEQIWPWLLQLGWGRAGWYGYDWVDNRGRPSAWEILPEHQHLEIGKDFPMSPMTSMYCVAFEEPRWMLWRGRPDPPASSATSAAGPYGQGAPVDRAQRLVASGGTWLWYLDPSTRPTRG